MQNETQITTDNNVSIIEDLTLDETSTKGVKDNPAYVGMDDIKGGQQKDHKNWINVASCNMGGHR